MVVGLGFFYLFVGFLFCCVGVFFGGERGYVSGIPLAEREIPRKGLL